MKKAAKAAKPAPSAPQPIIIPLSAHQLQRFTAFQIEAQTAAKAIELRVSDTVTAIVAGQIDPATVQGWNIQLTGESITCTPPAPAEAPKPQLVKDIGENGVSEAAATGQ